MTMLQAMDHGFHCVCVEGIMRTAVEYDDNRLKNVKCCLGYVQMKNLYA